MLQIGFKLKPFLCHIFSYKIINLKMLTRVQVNKFVKDNLEDSQFLFWFNLKLKYFFNLERRTRTLLQSGVFNFTKLLSLSYNNLAMAKLNLNLQLQRHNNISETSFWLVIFDYFMKAIALRCSRELVFMTPCWCTSSSHKFLDFPYSITKIISFHYEMDTTLIHSNNSFENGPW